ncbi:MAG TPA: polysaccharide deacetylase family protein [Candidatus Lokiarchaeia archaeon]
MYHEVTNTPERQKRIKKIDPSYSITSEQFEKHIKYLYKIGYKTILPDEIITNTYDRQKRFVLTFDDGLIGNYEFAFPIIREYKYLATIFVSVKNISSARFMNWEQLKELSSNGFLIQSHTMTHSPLGTLSEKEIFYELSDSKACIEDKIGKEVKYLSLPYGSCNRDVYQIANEIGYVGIFTSTPYKNDLTVQPFSMGRIPIKDNYNINKFAKIISNESIYYYKMKYENNLKTMIKKIIGLNNYRKIYRFYNRIEI